MIGNSNDDTDFLHKSLLTNRQVTNLRKTFANNLSTDITLSKTQLSKVIHSGKCFSRFLGPLLKTGLPLIKKVIKPFTKSVLIPLQLRAAAAAAAADARIHKKNLGSGKRLLDPASQTRALIVLNDEMEDIMKIVKSPEHSGLLLKGISETIQNEAKEQKGGFLSMLLDTLGASLLGNMLASKGITRADYGFKGKGIIKGG